MFTRRTRMLAMLVVLIFGLCAWYFVAGGSPGRSDESPVAARDPSSAAARQLGPVVVAPQREDIWNTIRPETREAVGAQMLGSAPGSGALQEVDQGSKGVMTRLPDRYRPVTVGTIDNGELVIGEVMSLPAEGPGAAVRNNDAP